MRMPKPSVTGYCLGARPAPVWYGRWPQSLKPSGERDYIVALAEEVGGVCEVTIPAGRVDVMRGRDEYGVGRIEVYEVEPAHHWRAGLRQCLAYAAATDGHANLCLFGPGPYLNAWIYLREHLPQVTLWVYAEKWRHHRLATSWPKEGGVAHLTLDGHRFTPGTIAVPK